MNIARTCLLAIALLATPGAGRGWGNDGHLLILDSALAVLPDAVRRIYAPGADRIRTYAVEPDRHSVVPAEGSRHYIDIELLDPAFMSGLVKELAKDGSAQGLADEDARGIAISFERGFFSRRPPPWSANETGRLWESLPPDLPAFRSAYPGMETIVGTVVYQPFLYTRALARAIREGDRQWILIYAGLLAHYTGDLFVPLHATIDYKGQYSGNLTFNDGKNGRGDVHSRFETAFVRHRLDSLRTANAARRREPKTIALAGITPAAINAGSVSYALIDPILASDRKAAAKFDPARAWARYATEVGPVFEPALIDRISLASNMLADLLLTAATVNLDTPEASGKIGER